MNHIVTKLDLERDYEEHLTRFCQMKRDLPWNSEQEPPRPNGMDFRVWADLRAKVLREFNRTE